MTEDDNRLLQDLSDLPRIAPDIEWETRVRTRCHAAIARRASRRARSGTNPAGAGLLDAVAAVAICAYLAAVLIDAARLGGLL